MLFSATRATPARELDDYLRRNDTLLGVSLRTVAPGVGEAYSSSHTKRMVDITLSLPALAIALIPTTLLIVTTKLLHPDLPAFFIQRRVGQQDGIRIVKIRTMTRVDHTYGPALTRFGRSIRRHKLDELLQIVQVLDGQLSLVGIRVLPYEIYRDLQATWSSRRFQRWSEAYSRYRLGLTGVHQVMRGTTKEDRIRFHRDMFYARHASLGFDLYLLWRTVQRILRPPG